MISILHRPSYLDKREVNDIIENGFQYHYQQVQVNVPIRYDN